MAKRFVACPFCWGKIKDSAIKCMHYKKWINNKDENNLFAVESSGKINVEKKKINIVNSEEDKKILWYVIWFLLICVFWVAVSCILIRLWLK